MPWDENNVTKLRELWDQGSNSSNWQILGFTKNAVVGKAHRIGLEKTLTIRRTAVKPDRKSRSPVMQN